MSSSPSSASLWRRSRVRCSPSTPPSSASCGSSGSPGSSSCSRWPRVSGLCWTLSCRHCRRSAVFPGYEEHFATSLYLLPRLGTLAFYSSYCFSFLPPLVWSFLEDLVSYIAYDLIILQNLHCVFILSSYLSTIHHRRLSIYRM